MLFKSIRPSPPRTIANDRIGRQTRVLSSDKRVPARCGPLMGMSIEPHEKFARSTPVEQVSLSRRMMRAGLPKLSLVIHGTDYAVHARKAFAETQTQSPLDERWTQHGADFNVYNEETKNAPKEHAGSFRFASSRSGGRVF